MNFNKFCNQYYHILTMIVPGLVIGQYVDVLVISCQYWYVDIVSWKYGVSPSLGRTETRTWRLITPKMVQLCN